MKLVKNGFTLLEMSIVLVIVSLLVLIIVPNLAQQKKHANTVHTGAMVTVVQTQLESYLDVTDDRSTSFAELQRAGYLTEKQVKMAKREGIRIDGTQVSVDS